MNSSAIEEIRVAAIPLIEPSLDVLESPQVGLQRVAKRAIDIAGALLVLVLFSPLLLLVCVAIVLDSGWPVLFRQQRVGEGGRLFTVYKFRSMRQGADKQMEAIKHYNQISDGPIFKWKNDRRVTRVGRLLRKTSLDEFPQLINVLLGNMSLVGPRPPLESETMEYEPWQLKRLAVKPGMTGLWQVSGRSDLNFSQMVQLDISYIENWSVWHDLLLLARTPLAVLTCRGAY